MGYKLPKLNLVCSKDGFRPSMSNIFIDIENGNCVATDARCMVIHKIEDLFASTGIAFKKSCYIPAEDWVELTKVFERLEIVENYLMVHRKKGAPVAVRLLNPEDETKYPPYLSVTPYGTEPVEKSCFAVNPEVLQNLCRAMTIELKPVTFTTYKDRVALSFSQSKTDYCDYEKSVKAFIMECDK